MEEAESKLKQEQNSWNIRRQRLLVQEKRLARNEGALVVLRIELDKNKRELARLLPERQPPDLSSLTAGKGSDDHDHENYRNFSLRM